MLADDVLPLIRTRAELYRWGTANAHGRQMHEVVDLLKQPFLRLALRGEAPGVVEVAGSA